MPQVETYILAGRYAQAYHLGNRGKRTLGDTVDAWREYAPRHFPLPHPSWHNNHWLTANPWFERELVPVLRQHVHALLS